MDNNTKDKVSELKKKVFSIWEAEGKWEAGNPNSPLYGLDRDPLLTLLLTAMVHQQNQMEEEVENYRKNMVCEFEDAVLPYHLTQATPALTMMCTAKAQGYGDEFRVGQDTDFKIQKEAFQTRESLPFCPLFESNIVGAAVKSVAMQSDGSCKLTLEVTDGKASLAGVGFFFKGLKFDDLSMQIEGKELPLIRPWEYDRFPMNPNFSFWNMIYNKSLLFGTNEQWFDLWAAQNLNYYMVDPQATAYMSPGFAELTLRFDGMKNESVGLENIYINSFPVVNVTKKTYRLTQYEPIVKIANDDDFFMNIVGESDTLDNADQFIIRRYGCERFSVDELLRLTNELQKRYNTDFYAYQIIPSLQSEERMNKLRVLLKDILTAIKKEGTVKTGIYAMLKADAKVELAIPLKALYTNGDRGNGIKAGAIVLTVPTELDLGQTRILTDTQGGRDEVNDIKEKKLLSHYYSLTNDKVVTRTDLKMFCIKELRKYRIYADKVEVVSDGACSRIVTAYASGINPELDLESVQQTIERLIDVHSSGLMPVKVKIAKAN